MEGKTKEAYEYALRSHMWTHALLLASNLSIDVFKQTVNAFASQSLTEGSPMRTLYSMFSGKFQGKLCKKESL